jgi:hypothetical protein
MWAVLIAAVVIVSERLEPPNLKPILIPVADFYLGVFSHPQTGIVLSAMMVLTGAAVAAWYWFARLRPGWRMLRRVRDDVRAISAMPPGSGSLGAAAILDEVLTHTALSADWRHYKSTILVSDHPERLWATYRPSAYFNLETLDRRGLGLVLLRSIPGYFVGVGLLFTFMGLVAGLYFASRGLMATDLPTARLALVQLLRTSTVKFSTSVAGLGISIAIAIWSRVLIDGFERLMGELCTALEDLVPLAPVHSAMTLRPWGAGEGEAATRDSRLPLGRRLGIAAGE